jgi:hypothetical protein
VVFMAISFLSGVVVARSLLRARTVPSFFERLFFL